MEVIGRGGLLLVDKSAWLRGVGDQLTDADFCFCDITRLEILHSARNHDEYVQMEAALDTFRTLTSNAETWAIARTAHRELAELGQHRVSIPDLLIAACAQQHGADVLHVDRHFDVLSRVLSFGSVRLDA